MTLATSRFVPTSDARSAMMALSVRKEIAVPIAVRITPTNMTRDDYETIMKQLEETGSSRWINNKTVWKWIGEKDATPA